MATIYPEASRITNWEPGVRTGVPGGIAQYLPGGANQRTSLIDVTAAPYFADNTGVVNARTAIQNAINAATAGQVVWMPAGTYLVTGGLTFSYQKKNITLRGAGIGQTRLNFVGGSFISIGSNSDYTLSYPSTNNIVTAGLTQGSTTVTIASTTAFSVGQIITFRFENQTNNAAIQAGGTQVFTVGGFKSMRRQRARVVSKTATTLTFDPPLFHAPQPGLEVKVVVAQFHSEFVGLEDFEVDLSQCTSSFAITYEQCYACWAYRIKSTFCRNYHIYMTNSLKCEILRCWLDDQQGAKNVSNHAALLWGGVSACLVRHSVIVRCFPCCEINFGSSGNAYLYNVNERHDNLSAGMSNINHAPHNSHNLYEGNVTPNFQSDGYFGGASEDTIFRNWIHGSILSGANITFVLSINRGAHKYNVLGNIFGRSGFKDGSNRSYGNPYMGNATFIGQSNAYEGSFSVDWNSTGVITSFPTPTSCILTANSGRFVVGLAPIQLWWLPTQTTVPSFTVSAVSGNLITLTGTAGTFPPEGTLVSVFMGANGYPEQDLACLATAYQKENYIALAAGGGAMAAGESLGADELPISMATTGEPSDWVAGFPFPPFDSRNPGTSQSWLNIPAGYWFVNGVWPGETLTAPVIILNPVAATVSEGGSVQLIANASGNPSPSWSWTRNGVVVEGANTRILTISDATEANEGSYVATASNSQGTVFTTAAYVTVNPVVDTLPPEPNPSQVSVLSQVDSSSQITLIAVTSADLGTPPVQYNHSINGVYQGWQSLPTKVFMGLPSFTSFTFRVKARDGLNNETTESAPTVLTTLVEEVSSQNAIVRTASSALLIGGI